jgi:beta-glucanase (GH16 family)
MIRSIKLTFLSFLVLFISCCKISKSPISNEEDRSFVDIQTPKKSKPFIVNSTDKNKWELAFSDEFNDSEIDTTKWNVENKSKPRKDIMLLADDNQVEEKNGNIYIYYRKAQLNDTTYYAGRFNSSKKYAPTYGFIETRMHIVRPNGYQMAFWMMPDQESSLTPNGVKDGTANDGAEIDIIEGRLDSDSYSTGLHWDGYSKLSHKSNGKDVKAPGLHDKEFHIYGFEWTPTYLKFYYDGKLVRTMNEPYLIPHVSHFLYFSGSCFGESNWVTGDVRKNEFIQNGNTAKSYVDYVRVYESKLK